MTTDERKWVITVVVGMLIGAAIGHVATWPHAYRAGVRHGQEMAPQTQASGVGG